MFDSYADVFAARAADYHGAMARWPDARDAEFRSVLDPLAGFDGLLCDMPAGGGYLARHLGAAQRYVGIEPSDGFFDSANRGLKRINADLTAVPVADGSVDAIVSLAGLHHEPDLAPVFAEMRRLVRPGGRLVIADVAAGSGPARFLNGFVADHNPQGHDGLFFDDSTPRLIEAAGLAQVDQADVAVPWRFVSQLEAGAFCKMLFGLPAVSAQAVADQLDRDIGFHRASEGVDLRWSLRRFICDA